MKYFKILIFIAFWSFASQISSLAVVIGVDLAGGAAGSLAGTLGEDFGLNNPYLQSQISSLAGGTATALAGGDYYTGSEIGGTIFNYNDNIIAEFSYGVYADDSDPNVQKAREVEEILSTIEGVGTLAVGGVSAATRPGFWKSIGSFFKNPFGLFGKGGKEVASVTTKGGIGKISNAGNYKFDMINNPGPLSKLRNNPASNFAGGKYNSVKLKDDLVLYRGGDINGNSLGQWFSSKSPNSVANVRIDNAVKSQWINPKTGVLDSSSPVNTLYKVKIPKGTVIYEGPIGYQGGVNVGGQSINQIFVPEPWKIKGVEVIGSPIPLK